MTTVINDNTFNVIEYVNEAIENGDVVIKDNKLIVEPKRQEESIKTYEAILEEHNRIFGEPISERNFNQNIMDYSEFRWFCLNNLTEELELDTFNHSLGKLSPKDDEFTFWRIMDTLFMRYDQTSQYYFILLMRKRLEEKVKLLKTRGY